MILVEIMRIQSYNSGMVLFVFHELKQSDMYFSEYHNKHERSDDEEDKDDDGDRFEWK